MTSARHNRKSKPRWFAVAMNAAILITGLVLIIVGIAAIKRPIYQPLTTGYGMLTYEQIGDQQMTIDATFGGITRRDGRLYSTYNRSQQRSKLACPT